MEGLYLMGLLEMPQLLDESYELVVNNGLPVMVKLTKKCCFQLCLLVDW